jgi:PAS domain S-box-containing protein
MPDIIYETLRALLAGVFFVYLLVTGQKSGLGGEKGWAYILGGFVFILLGMLIDITDNFPIFNKYIILGDTDSQAILKEVVCYLFGFILLSIGIWMWIPNIIERKKAEEALRESEDRYRAIVEDQTEYIMQWLPDGTRTFANQAYCKYFSLSSQECIGSSFFPLIAEEDRDNFRKKIDTLTPEKPVTTTEHRVFLPDGKIRWNRWTDRAIFDEQDRLVRFQSVGRDVTDRKQAEEALELSRRELEARNESLHIINQIAQKLHNSLDPITIADEAVRSLVQYSRSPMVAFLMLSEEGNGLDLLSQFGFSEETLKVGSRLPLLGSLSGITMSRKTLLTSDDIQNDDRLEPTVRDNLLNQGLRSLVSVPLLFQDEALGVINLICKEAHSFKDYEYETLLSVGKTAGMAMANARHVAQIEREVNVRTQAESSLLQSEKHLRRLSSRLQEVQELERKGLARELHDQVGQTLTGLNINLNIIRSQLSDESLKKVAVRVDDSMSLMEETGERIRDVMANLRPQILDDYGLIPALRWYTETFQERTGIAVIFHRGDLTIRMPELIELALFRITQEALNNIAKHAEAQQVTLTFDATDGLFRLTIVDDGKGFDLTALNKLDNRRGWGLLTMQERALALGGHVLIESEPGKGSRIIIEVKKQKGEGL